MTSIEYKAEETPSSWRYSPTRPEKKIVSHWKKPSAKLEKKNDLGPGKYEEGIKKAYKNIMKNSPNYSFSRSKTPSVYHVKAAKSQYIPGVGAYKGSDTAFKKNLVKRQREVIIFPYQIRTFTESVIKKSHETPGPGAYQIIPPIKNH